jgi:mitochondrial import receptor subunit TOM22
MQIMSKSNLFFNSEDENLLRKAQEEEDELEEGEIENDEDFVTEDEDDDEDDDEEEEEDEEDDDEDDEEEEEFASETLFQRIAALQDIIRPTTRVRIYKTVSSTVSSTLSALQAGGKLGWIVATSALLVVLPVALEVERETFALQQENAQRVQQMQAQQVLKLHAFIHFYSLHDHHCHAWTYLLIFLSNLLIGHAYLPSHLSFKSYTNCLYF